MKSLVQSWVHIYIHHIFSHIDNYLYFLFNPDTWLPLDRLTPTGVLPNFEESEDEEQEDEEEEVKMPKAEDHFDQA